MAKRVLLVTANVGSLFEQPSSLLHHWKQQFGDLLLYEKPDFFALHLQELGGKSNDLGRNSHLLETIIKFFFEHKALSMYTIGRAFMDQDHKDDELYTALGSIYLVHQSIAEQTEMFSFVENQYVPVAPPKQVSINLEQCNFVDRQKFPIQYFPQGKLSRKGFMRTMWSLGNMKMELSNIHLFHDDSNLRALQSSPSDYAVFRRNALSYFLGKLDISVPSFIFGDFNFRTDTKALISYLISEKRYALSKSINKVSIDNESTEGENCNENVMEVEAKKFNLKFGWLKEKDFLRQFDTEVKAFPFLKELPADYLPTYPICEDSAMAYNNSRCPSWCDRVLFCPEASRMIDHSEPVAYKILGSDFPMGDHKPVYVAYSLRPELKNNLSPSNFREPIAKNPNNLFELNVNSY
ncbi:inositol polyphosphate-5-phosphatase A-like [Symsagittifera roscoffensis]|uniref:inositol polyphosphate-5-phosphatase A-like n=1 Tax=Symsagittifera roscoffensis TaxID=84072 RepID=UPI00307B769E